MLDAAGGDLLFRFKSGNGFNQRNPFATHVRKDFLFLSNKRNV